MAALTVKEALIALADIVRQKGQIRAVTIGEPKAITEPTGITAAVFLRSLETIYAVMGEVTFLHTANIRFYRSMMAEPTDETEYRMAAAAETTITAILDTIDLANGTVGAGFSNPDIAELWGGRLAGEWGYQDVGGPLYRILTFTVPLPIYGGS